VHPLAQNFNKKELAYATVLQKAYKRIITGFFACSGRAFRTPALRRESRSKNLRKKKSNDN
jgi:hypothetical protein